MTRAIHRRYNGGLGIGPQINERKEDKMTMGKCKHGEFELTKGCPQCVAERQAAEAEVNSPDNVRKQILEADDYTAKRIKEAEEAAVMGTPYIVKVQYSITKKAGTVDEYVQFGGRAYTYFTAEPLDVGDVVQVPVANHNIKGKVVEINVPESEIAAFRDKVKTIQAGSKLTDQKPDPNAWRMGEEEVRQEEPEQLQARLTLSEDVSEETKEAAVVLEDITGGQIQVEPVVPNSLAAAAKAAGAEVTEVNLAEDPVVPSALVTIETQVGKPAPELLQLYQQAASLLQFAKARVITTNEDLKPAADDLAIIAICKKAMAARKTELYGPKKAALDQFSQAFNDLMFPVLEADRITKGQVNDFGNEQRRKAATLQRIEDEKLRLAKEEAALNGTGEHTQELGTAVVPPPVPERTRTDLGTLGGRTNWKARVVDFKALPDEYKLPNESMLNSFARSTKGKRPIPGVEFYDDHIVTMRTKG